MNFLKRWFRDTVSIMFHEFRNIFTDSGVMIIFFVAGIGYPLLYNVIYHNGILEEVPVAVVDRSHSAESRRFIHKVDATRELDVVQKCVDMEEAKALMQHRKVRGILYFPEDYGRKITQEQTGTLSAYADMSSFLYYKNIMLGANFVMLDEINSIKLGRLQDYGMTHQEAEQMVQAIPYEENNPYNKTFSYTIFFISAALLLIVQQVMFYGMILRSGTAKEEGHSYYRILEGMRSAGVGRVVLGRGAAYWIIFMCIGIYVACIVPALFGFPQRGSFSEILLLLLFFVTDCVFFASFWGSFFTRRETVLVTLLFISPIAMFLTGFSWPVTSFPAFWRWFSYIFPTSFACPAFINLNTAGCDLSEVHEFFNGIILQTLVYCSLTFIVAFRERRLSMQ